MRIRPIMCGVVLVCLPLGACSTSNDTAIVTTAPRASTTTSAPSERVELCEAIDEYIESHQGLENFEGVVESGKLVSLRRDGAVAAKRAAAVSPEGERDFWRIVEKIDTGVADHYDFEKANGPTYLLNNSDAQVAFAQSQAVYESATSKCKVDLEVAVPWEEVFTFVESEQPQHP